MMIPRKWKRDKIQNISVMLKSCLDAEGKVGLMMNARHQDLEKIISLLPALQKPTVSKLSDPEWVGINTIVNEIVVRTIVPDLKVAGAKGIVEYSINKIID